MKIQATVAALALSAFASAQKPTSHPWQQIQNPTAAQVLAAWKTPPPEYGPEPYYGLNGNVTPEVMRRDVDTLQKLGFTAVTAQYGTGMPFGYLSPEHFAFMRQFITELKQRNMKLWLVDDAGYPSGFAGGKFTTEHPELRMQALVVAQKLTLKAGGVVDTAVPPNLVTATAIPELGGEPVPLVPVNGRLSWTAPSGVWTVYIVTHDFRTSPTRSDTNPKRVKDGSQSLEDYLDPAATAQYIRFTHEAYKQALGDEFGKTILGFRGDEPDYSLSGLPWTPKFFDAFQKAKGYDVRPYVVYLLQSKDAKLTERQTQIKADYYDVFAQLFRDGFFKPQGDWCAANGLEYQVHLNHEEMQLQLVHSEGSFFRDMHYVQVPGIDSIWHQIWTDTVSDFPRLASSAAHIYGHPRSFTESFAAYRPTPDLTMARYILNEQLVRGINLVETMYVPASTTATAGPATFMKDPGYPALMEYTRRISYLMSMGHPAASTALLLPASSLWTGNVTTDDTFVSTERLLSEHQIDFDIVDEDAISSTLKSSHGAFETLSGNRYQTVIVPAASVMTQASVDKLKSFAAAGGKVLFLGGTPTQLAGKTFRDAHTAKAADFAWASVSMEQLAPTPTPPAQPPTTAPEPQVVSPELLKALQAATPQTELTLATPSTGLRFTHRTLKDATVFLLFNESSTPIQNTVQLHAAGATVEAWDPQTATSAAIPGASAARGLVQLPLTLAPYTSEIVVVR